MLQAALFILAHLGAVLTLVACLLSLFVRACSMYDSIGPHS